VKIYVSKLGCPKNDVDADYISGRLLRDGHELVNDPLEAESVIVNTCAFIQAAKEESIEELLRLGQLKKEGQLKMLLASGCMSQRYGSELLDSMPELDGVFGLGELDAIACTMQSATTGRIVVQTDASELHFLCGEQRHVADAFPYAYLKIADGCNRLCSYCAIPSIRGRYRSRSLESIVTEAKLLASQGKKELILVSQEGTLWGADSGSKQSITGLLKELERVEGIEWIRLMYLHPAKLDEDLIEYLGAENKSLNYFDLPLQHINTEMLRAMNRPIDRPRTEEILQKVRRLSPESTIRTTFIVGFPGETEEQFEELLEFVREFRFDRLGAFTYSFEEDTPAAQLPNQIEEEVAAERVDRLMRCQFEIVQEKNNSLIGEVVDVIIDQVTPDEAIIGRTAADCPEIDQEVHFQGDGLQIGDFCRVRIESVDGYDLDGVLVSE